MKKLKVAIIGQGRSGKDIHGVYHRSADNKYYEVGYVVDRDEGMRKLAGELYPGCVTLSEYTELFGRGDIDLVVNASYSAEHFEIAKAFLERGVNVLTEKPFAPTVRECFELIETAKKSGAVLAVFHNTQLAPFYLDALEKTKGGKLGQIKQINIRYNGLARRWDWQTLQKNAAGSAYNTGPHPVAMALGFLGFDKNMRVEFSSLGTALTSGDADDCVKIILTAPGKPVVDIEINSNDAFSDYTLKLMGTRGTMKNTPKAYTLKYFDESENEPRPVVEQTLRNDEGMPIYCKEKLITHEESGEYNGNAFDVGTAGIYESVYYAITENRPLAISNEQAAQVIEVIEKAHADNPLPVKYL